MGVWTSIDQSEQFGNLYAYTGNGTNPIGFSDDDGEWLNFAIGFAVGAGSEYAIQIATSMVLEKKSFGEAFMSVDATDVLVAGAGGMIGGLGCIDKIRKVNKLVSLGTDFTLNAATSTAQKAANGELTQGSAGSIARTAAIGTGLGVIAKVGATAIVGKKTIEKAQRIEVLSGEGSRNSIVQTTLAKSEAINAGVNSALTVGQSSLEKKK